MRARTPARSFPTLYADWAPTGTANFRELGGLPTADGGRIRSGVLYRSDTPQLMTADDVETLVHRLGLRLVVDLRYRAEAELEGRGLLGETAVRYVNAPVVGTGGEDVDEA